MQSEPFWSLIPNSGCEKWIQSKSSMRSFKNLTVAIKYALIEKELVDILIDPVGRDILKISILEKYFPNNCEEYNNDNDDLPSGNILHDDSEKYRQKIIDLKSSVEENKFQEEVFIRSGIFRREIPKLYNNTCAISNLRIDSISVASMIDACHIVPFSESYDDTISNGIALCPNLHRAFDRGLISISDDYKVLLSKNFIESNNSSYSISQFENKIISLPSSIESYPSLKNLELHRQRFDF
jgi:putative restriction endonuclease